ETSVFFAPARNPASIGGNSVICENVSIGVYGIIDEVTFEPTRSAPTTIRIAGVFVVPISPSSGDYKSPQRGFLYFRIRPGMEPESLRDWHALRKAAGTSQVVGFSEYWVLDAHDPTENTHLSLQVEVHPEGKTATPEIYPIPNRKGVVTRGDEADPKFDK